MITLAFILQGGFGGLIIQLLPFILIFVIFYFLVIMPQRRKQQELQDMIAGLKNGDKIVTNGGVIGEIVQTKDKSFIIRSADKSFIEVARSAVVGKEIEQ
jgi:preprotein translocase subunit YajC